MNINWPCSHEKGSAFSLLRPKPVKLRYKHLFYPLPLKEDNEHNTTAGIIVKQLLFDTDFKKYKGYLISLLVGRLKTTLVFFISIECMPIYKK